jgi:hypothetical protein
MPQWRNISMRAAAGTPCVLAQRAPRRQTWGKHCRTTGPTCGESKIILPTTERTRASRAAMAAGGAGAWAAPAPAVPPPLLVTRTRCACQLAKSCWRMPATARMPSTPNAYTSALAQAQQYTHDET